MLSAAASCPPTFGQNGRMLLDEAYRILEIEPTASDEQIKAAHRDLTKVWHPDRFASDPSMRRKAEEKVKRINEAVGVIQAARGGTGARWAPPPRTPGRVTSGVRGFLFWIFFLAFTASFILLRRPTPGGLIAAAGLFAVVVILVLRMRRRPL